MKTNKVNVSMTTGFLFDDDFMKAYNKEIDTFGFDDSMDIIYPMEYVDFIKAHEAELTDNSSEEDIKFRFNTRIKDITYFLDKNMQIRCFKFGGEYSYSLVKEKGEIFMIDNSEFDEFDFENFSLSDFVVDMKPLTSDILNDPHYLWKIKGGVNNEHQKSNEKK